MASASLKPVKTFSPFFPMTMAVPVSWQFGRIPLAAISAFLRRVRATILSFSVASGSSSMAATCLRCDERSLKQMAFDASFERLVSASWVTVSISLLPSFSIEMPSVLMSSYSVGSDWSGNGFW